ncbi:uncharacterized protein TNCV_2609671 [Trichonephila clavipes]|nr:uncharacterized protein TNCV_2609671 [Trichonephila clavipes]
MSMRCESLLNLNLHSSVKSSHPHSLSLQFRCSRHHRERLFRWAGVKGTHRTGRRANRPPPCNLLATAKRDISRPVACIVCLAISPTVCHLFLLAYKTMYRSSAGVAPRGRPLLHSRIAVPVVRNCLQSHETML